MKIVILTPTQFDNYSFNHPLHSFYQTSMYANLMKEYNYDIEYYGFADDNNNLIGASLILTQKIAGNYKYGYAPRGFLINYDDKELIKELTIKFKSYFSKLKYVFLKIDPIVINNKRDRDGNIIPSLYSSDLIPYLCDIGYSYFGENKFFGTLKPRWNAILKVTGTSTTIFKSFDDQVRNKIRKAQSRGVEIFQGTYDDMKMFYSFVAKKHYRKLEYYQNFSKCFGDRFELYFARLNSEEYLKNIKKLYELEISKNESLNSEIQEKSATGKVSEKLMNSKLTSDKLINTYKSELAAASELFTTNPKGIVIGACAIILDRNGVELLIEGQNPKYGLYYPMYLLKWHVIGKYAKQGAVYFDLNAITGFFEEDNKYKGLNETKLGFGADVTEYIGEFDLVIKPQFYRFYCKGKLWRKIMRNKSK